MKWLIFKLPKDKPPFVGVRFENLYEARKHNEELLSIDSNFQLFFEPIAEIINLKLVCDNPYLIRFYNDLFYDANDFRKWLDHAKLHSQMIFGHVIKEGGEDKPVQRLSEKKYFVLKIEQYILRNS